jgi:hypothetical protein
MTNIIEYSVCNPIIAHILKYSFSRIECNQKIEAGENQFRPTSGRASSYTMQQPEVFPFPIIHSSKAASQSIAIGMMGASQQDASL